MQTWEKHGKTAPKIHQKVIRCQEKLMFHGHPPRVPSQHALFTPMFFIFDEVNVCIENSTQNVARS